ncbi:Deoxyhypusine synthase [Trichinella nelsoni]|uniref:deoxyhypusine synthase n=1 Tax=Trichinella nelsoni TaxID=6336 RepID=A0A0V0S9F7_9BILA|nr:Deoxyhypusine synthase [Trichinella nelsoni]
MESSICRQKSSEKDDGANFHQTNEQNGRNFNKANSLLSQAECAVLKMSEPMPCNAILVHGYDFNVKLNDYSELFNSFATTGFQAKSFSDSVIQINKMLDEKKSIPEFEDPSLSEFEFPNFFRPKTGCTIFLAYTSNMISSGLREVIRFLVEHNMVDCLVTSAGGIEEDLIKCLAPTYLGDFRLDGAQLRQKGFNRIGDLLIPNRNYCLFEDWLMPILDKLVEEQTTQNVSWTPHKLIYRLGQEINCSQSIYYWAAKNKIPVFCPGITDGSLGDMLYFHSIHRSPLKLDIVEDVRLINDMAVKSVKTGMIILGAGLIKHHVCNANLMVQFINIQNKHSRNGANYSVFVNTAQEYDGSDAGALPDEAVSWGKIRSDAKPVKLFCDATIAFPLLVSQTFLQHHQQATAQSLSQ